MRKSIATMSISFLYHMGSFTMTLMWHMAHTEKTFTKKIEY